MMLPSHFVTKHIWGLLSYFENGTFYVKTALATFGPFFEKLGSFLFHSLPREIKSTLKSYLMPLDQILVYQTS